MVTDLQHGFEMEDEHQANGCKTKVIGAPKTIDEDLKCLMLDYFVSFVSPLLCSPKEIHAAITGPCCTNLHNVLIISCCSPCSKVPTTLACVVWLRHSLQDLRDIGRPTDFASLQMVRHTLAWAFHIAF